MSNEPYHIYYLSIVTQPNLSEWDKSRTKEIFMENCTYNMDERAMTLLCSMNKEFVEEFVLKADTTDSANVIKLSKKF